MGSTFNMVTRTSSGSLLRKRLNLDIYDPLLPRSRIKREEKADTPTSPDSDTSPMTPEKKAVKPKREINNRNGPYYCKLCGEEFEASYLVANHVSRHHHTKKDSAEKNRAQEKAPTVPSAGAAAALSSQPKKRGRKKRVFVEEGTGSSSENTEACNGVASTGKFVQSRDCRTKSNRDISLTAEMADKSEDFGIENMTADEIIDNMFEEYSSQKDIPTQISPRSASSSLSIPSGETNYTSMDMSDRTKRRRIKAEVMDFDELKKENVGNSQVVEGSVRHSSRLKDKQIDFRVFRFDDHEQYLQYLEEEKKMLAAAPDAPKESSSQIGCNRKGAVSPSPSNGEENLVNSENQSSLSSTSSADSTQTEAPVNSTTKSSNKRGKYKRVKRPDMDNRSNNIPINNSGAEMARYNMNEGLYREVSVEDGQNHNLGYLDESRKSSTTGGVNLFDYSVEVTDQNHLNAVQRRDEEERVNKLSRQSYENIYESIKTSNGDSYSVCAPTIRRLSVQDKKDMLLLLQGAMEKGLITEDQFKEKRSEFLLSISF